MKSLKSKALKLPNTYFAVKDILDMNQYQLDITSELQYQVKIGKYVITQGDWEKIEEFARGYQPMPGDN